MGRWKKSQQEEIIETEICEKTGKEAQADVKNQQNTTPHTNDVSVTIKPAKENGESS